MSRLQQVEKDLCLPVYFTEFVVQIGNLKKRFHLSHNAAHIFPSKDMSRIGAILQIPLVQTSHYASCIVAHMLIAYFSGIDTVINLSFRIPRNAPCVRMYRHTLRSAQILDIFHRDILNPLVHFRCMSIDIA